MSTEHSEFGGAPGLIQPQPHDVGSSAREQAFLERASDPGDEADSPDQVLARVLAGTYGVAPPAEPVVPGPLQPEASLVQLSNAVPGQLRFIGVGNSDLRTAQLKVSADRRMYPATYGPEKEYAPSPAVVMDLAIGSLAVGHYFVQVVMNGLQVTEVWEVDVVQ